MRLSFPPQKVYFSRKCTIRNNDQFLQIQRRLNKVEILGMTRKRQVTQIHRLWFHIKNDPRKADQKLNSVKSKRLMRFWTAQSSDLRLWFESLFENLPSPESREPLLLSQIRGFARCVHQTSSLGSGREKLLVFDCLSLTQGSPSATAVPLGNHPIPQRDYPPVNPIDIKSLRKSAPGSSRRNNSNHRSNPFRKRVRGQPFRRVAGNRNRFDLRYIDLRLPSCITRKRCIDTYR